jgi:pimeloyl-ACP methyl ester carboxylesterase
VSTRFGDIAYLESGEGPAAVFIHGVFLNADLWCHQLEALAGHRRCLAVDLLAHGRSPCPDEPDVDVGVQADMIVAFIDALALDSVDLVGHDSGGAIAQLVVVRVPLRVRTLTLTNCDAHDNWPPAAFAPIVDMARAGTLADALRLLAADPAGARASLASGLECPDELSDRVVMGFLGPFAAAERAEAVQAYVAGMDDKVTVAIRDDLARFRSPTLIVWGGADQFFDMSWARWLAATIPGTVRCVEIEGAKLFFPLERPATLNRELRALWTEARYPLVSDLPSPPVERTRSGRGR